VTIPGGSNSTTVTITGTDAGFTTANQDVIVGDNERPYQYQRNPLDVDASGGVFALDALKIINIINEIGVGDAATIMASYTGPVIYPDTNGDNFITAADVLDVINFLNQPAPPVGGRGRSGRSPVLGSSANQPASCRFGGPGDRGRKRPPQDGRRCPEQQAAPTGTTPSTTWPRNKSNGGRNRRLRLIPLSSWERAGARAFGIGLCLRQGEEVSDTEKLGIHG